MATSCPNCGKPVKPGTKFCGNCGNLIPVAPSQPPIAAQPAAMSAQAVAGSVCPHCGKAVRAGARFCASCGKSIGGEAGQPGVAVAIPPVAPPAGVHLPGLPAKPVEVKAASRKKNSWVGVLLVLLVICGLAAAGGGLFLANRNGWIKIGKPTATHTPTLTTVPPTLTEVVQPPTDTLIPSDTPTSTPTTMIVITSTATLTPTLTVSAEITATLTPPPTKDSTKEPTNEPKPPPDLPPPPYPGPHGDLVND